jgi:hypothetical protein
MADGDPAPAGTYAAASSGTRGPASSGTGGGTRAVLGAVPIGRQLTARAGVTLKECQSVKKLDHDNFSTWLEEMMPIVKWTFPGFSDSAVLAPEADEMLEQMLGVACTATFARMVRTAGGGMKAWEQLRQHFGQTNAAQAHLLTIQLHRMQQKQGESITAYSLRAMDLWQRLNSIPGQNVQEGQVVMTMLTGLQPHLLAVGSTIMQSYMKPGATPGTFADIMPSLNFQEQVMSKTAGRSGSAALFGQAATSRQPDNRGRGRGNGGGRGNGYSRGNQGGRGRGSGGRCFKCHQVGHGWASCPNPPAAQPAAGPAPAQAAAKPAAINIAFMAKVVDTPGWVVDSWVVDSGATEHISRNRGAFTDYTPVEGRTVLVGNGQLARVLGMGTVVLHVDQTRITLLEVLHVAEAPANLLSVIRAAERGLTTHFSLEGCKLELKGTLVAVAPLEGRVWVLHA